MLSQTIPTLPNVLALTTILALYWAKVKYANIEWWRVFLEVDKWKWFEAIFRYMQLATRGLSFRAKYRSLWDFSENFHRDSNPRHLCHVCELNVLDRSAILAIWILAIVFARLLTKVRASDLLDSQHYEFQAVSLFIWGSDLSSTRKKKKFRRTRVSNPSHPRRLSSSNALTRSATAPCYELMFSSGLNALGCE